MTKCLTDNTLQYGSKLVLRMGNTPNTKFGITWGLVDGLSVPTAQTLDCCKCHQAYLGSVVSPRYQIRRRREETGTTGTCFTDGGGSQSDSSGEAHGYYGPDIVCGAKSWKEIFRDPYLGGTGVYPPIAEYEEIDNSHESESETTHDEFSDNGVRTRCKGWKYGGNSIKDSWITCHHGSFDPVAPADVISSWPMGKICDGTTSYCVYDKFQCNRILVFKGIKHDGTAYDISNGPDEVLRPGPRGTQAPLAYPYLWRTCPYIPDVKFQHTGDMGGIDDESLSTQSFSSDSSISSESSIFDDNIHKLGGDYLYFGNYVNGANYDDIKLNGYHLLCILSNNIGGSLEEYFKIVPPHCKHTLVLSVSSYYYTVKRYDISINCRDDFCQLPRKEADIPKTLIEKKWLDSRAYAWIIKDGCSQELMTPVDEESTGGYSEGE